MNRRFLIWDNPRDALLSLVCFLMVVGAVNIFSASFVAAKDMFGNGYYYLIRYGIYGFAGLVIMWLLGKRDYHKLFVAAKPAFVAFFLMLLYVDAFGKATKGAQRWISLGPVSFQPSEFVKLGVILLGAAYLGPRMEKKMPISLFTPQSGTAFWAAALLAFLVLKQPDMGTAAIILALMAVLYRVAGLSFKKSHVVLAVTVLVAGVVAAIRMSPYRMNRILIWFNPESDPQGNGYQAVQSFVAIGSGGIFGNPFGMGMGPSKFFFLPEAHTDFAFAVFCQEWGFLGALFLLGVFLLMAAALVRIAQNTRDCSGFLLVTGANFLIVGQAIANMAMVCGVLPVIGVPLSFISYGGTSLMATLMAMGLVFSVYNQECLRERKEQLHMNLAEDADRRQFGRHRV